MRVAVSVIAAMTLVGTLAAAAPGGVERPGSPERGGAAAAKFWPTYRQPAWSATGQIAFLRSNVGGGESFWVMNADGSGARPLVSGHDLHSPDWSPDASRLVYHDLNGLYVVNRDGTGKRVLVSEVNAGEPAWSPDGTRIAYVTSEKIGVHQIHLIDPDGSNARDTGLRGSSPTWSPDGSKLAFLAENPGGSTNEIDVAPSDGSGAPEQFVTGSTILDPAWSPDGRTIAFAAITTGLVEAIWTAAYPATEAPRVLDSTAVSLGRGGHTGHPDWSPNGQQIVFEKSPALTPAQAACLKLKTSCPVHPGDLYVVGKDGGAAMDITFNVTGGKPTPTHCLPQSGELASTSALAAVQLCFQKASGTLHGRTLKISGLLGPSGAHIPAAVRANLETMTGYATVWRIPVRKNGTFAGARSLTRAQVRNLRTFQYRVRLAAGTFGSIFNRTSTTIKIKRR